MGPLEIFPDVAGGLAVDARVALAPGVAWVVLALAQVWRPSRPRRGR